MCLLSLSSLMTGEGDRLVQCSFRETLMAERWSPPSTSDTAPTQPSDTVVRQTGFDVTIGQLTVSDKESSMRNFRQTQDTSSTIRHCRKTDRL